MSFNNRGAQFANVLAVQTTLSPAQVATITAPEQTFTVPGVPDPAVSPSIVVVNCHAPLAGVALAHARASAANQIGLQFVNPTAGNLTPTASTVYRVLAMW